MTRNDAILKLAEFIVNMDIDENASAEDGAILILDFAEEVLKMKPSWESDEYESH